MAYDHPNRHVTATVPATVQVLSANPPGRCGHPSARARDAGLRVLISDRVAKRHPFAPMHCMDETAATGRIDALVRGLTDPHSGQPASKSVSVAIRPFATRWYGFAVADRAFRPDCQYWARAPLPSGMQAEMAGIDAPEDWATWADRLFGRSVHQMYCSDPGRGLHRVAFLDRGRLAAALFVPRTCSLVTQPCGGKPGRRG